MTDAVDHGWADDMRAHLELWQRGWKAVPQPIVCASCETLQPAGLMTPTGLLICVACSLPTAWEQD